MVPVNPRKDQILRLVTIIGVMTATIGCDQVSKIAARSFLSAAHAPSYFGGILKLTLAQNPGAFLSLGAKLPDVYRFLVFSILGSVIVALGLGYLLTKQHLTPRFVMGASLVLGGATGNLIDRFLFHGLVTDFLFLSVGALHTGVFNIADMAVMIGAGLGMLESRGDRPPKTIEPASR